MKKSKYILISALIISFFLTALGVSAATPNYFLKRGDTITLLKDTWVFGDTSNPIAGGKFTNLTVDTLTIGAIIAIGDMDMGGNNINNAGIITAENFVATSTTVASLFQAVGVGTTSTTVLLNVGSTTPTTVSGYRDAFFSGAVEIDGLLTLDTVLGVSSGGTGSTTLTGLLKGNGTSMITSAIADTDYQVPLTFGDGLTRTLNDVDVDTTQNIAILSNLTSNGFVKTSGSNGTLSIDTSTYLSNTDIDTLAELNALFTGETIASTTNVWTDSYISSASTWNAKLDSTDIDTMAKLNAILSGETLASTTASNANFINDAGYLTSVASDATWTVHASYPSACATGVVTGIGDTLDCTATSTLGLVTIGGAFHDGFSDFVANEHIDWTGESAGTIHATNYVDNNTTYSAGGTLLNETNEVFSINEGTLTNTKYCIYTEGTGIVCNSEGGASFTTVAGLNALFSGETVASTTNIWDFSDYTNATDSTNITFTDDAISVTDPFTITKGNITNASTTLLTATTIWGALTGNASTASALASNPTDCGANTWATTIAANGNLTCAAVTYAGITAMTSANLATIVSDETGTDKLVYNTSPTLVTPVLGSASSTQLTVSSESWFADDITQSSGTTTLTNLIVSGNMNKPYITVCGDGSCDYTTDGTADDVQIQAAIDAVNADGGGIIFIKKGTYNTTATISLKKTVSILGEGRIITEINYSGEGKIIDLSIDANEGVYTSIKDISIDGNDGATTTGISITGADRFLIEDVFIDNVASSGVAFIPLAVSGTKYITLRNVYAIGGDYGLQAARKSHYLVIEGGRYVGNIAGIYIPSSDKVIIDGVHTENVSTTTISQASIYITDDDSTYDCRGIHITNCHITETRLTAVKITNGCYDVWVDNNTFDGDNDNKPDYLIEHDGSLSSFSNNYIISYGISAILFDTNSSVSTYGPGNTFHSVTDNGTDNKTIYTNIPTNNQIYFSGVNVTNATTSLLTVSGQSWLANTTLAGALTIDQNADAIALNIDSEATTAGSYAIQAYTPLGIAMAFFGNDGNDNYIQINAQDSASGLLRVYRDYASAVTAGAVGSFIQDNASDDQNVLNSVNDGTGNGLFIDQNGNGVALNIDNDGTANSLTVQGTTAYDLVVLKSGYVGIGTTTPGSLLSLNDIANFTTATSTFYSTGGIDLTSGCFAIGGTCIAGGSSFSTIAGLNALFSGETVASTTWAGATSITTLGTIATGVWQGTDVGVEYGGTGVSSLNDGFILLGAGTGAIATLDLTTKGSIIVGDGTTAPIALAVGTNGQVLTASSTVASGLIWATIAGSGDVVKVGTPVDSQIGVWTGNGTIEGASSLTYDGANLQLTGDIGSTDTKITKGWFTDLAITNAIAGSVTGNAGTVTDGVYTTSIDTLAKLNALMGETIASTTWAGATSILTLGTIGAGTWQGTDIGVQYLASTTPGLMSNNDFGDWTCSGGVCSLDDTFLTGNETITLSGGATGSGATAITVELATTTIDYIVNNSAGVTGNANIVTVGTLTAGATGANFTVDLDASTVTCTNCLDIVDDTTSTLTVARGGTGVTSFTANSLLYSNGAGTALAYAATSTLSIGGNAATVTNGVYTTSINTIGKINSYLSGETIASTTWAGASSILTVGVLNSGSITSGFGSINSGTSLSVASTSPAQELTITGQMFIDGADNATSTIQGNFSHTNNAADHGCYWVYGATTTLECF